MDDPRRLEAKGLARAKIRAKRRRVSSIRSRTIRGSLALFAVVWVVIFGQLVTGNDPVLGRGYPAKRKPIASRPVPEVEVEPAPEVEFEPEEPEPVSEPAPEPEPEPVVTSAS